MNTWQRTSVLYLLAFFVLFIPFCRGCGAGHLRHGRRSVSFASSSIRYDQRSAVGRGKETVRIDFDRLFALFFALGVTCGVLVVIGRDDKE